ncbi:hypothetical protein HII17_12355 [Thalassotalea sp. M1531]|uniref:Uncharacterized protein n=1 Tax=Thalassotalea algicola TaxID=2716224 RepID=A0A7Y0LDT9_9GAMM|nr:hypothetical protein [Thalassotalea algicola]NMP32354.1 hypothetical protein [Thalassotalea algicola]
MKYVNKSSIAFTSIIFVLLYMIDTWAINKGVEVRKELDKKYAHVIREDVADDEIKTVKLSRELGNSGVTFNAILSVDNKKVKLQDNYVEGATGTGISVAGNGLEIGIKNTKFWIEQNTLDNETVYDVYVNFQRKRWLIRTENATSKVGMYIPHFVNQSPQNSILTPSVTIKSTHD